MSLVASLARAYERLPDKPEFGYSVQKIGFCVVLRPDGSVAEVADLRDHDMNRSPRLLPVPASPKRSGQTPRPFFIWDNINYALGAGKLTKPGDTRHDSFREKHLKFLRNSESADIRSFCAFLQYWSPEQVRIYFDTESPPTEGIVFACSPTYREQFLHENSALRDLWSRERERWIAVEGKKTVEASCIITGQRSPIERTHPPIKGVWKPKKMAESALVTFNSDAYESYGHKQGDNAPVSKSVAFAYTTALNQFLADQCHRLQVGDASTVFWADSSDQEKAQEAEALFAGMFDTISDDHVAASRVKNKLDAIRIGSRLAQVDPQLDAGVRFFVLGLSPNASRLSVRFFWESDFGPLTANYQRFLQDMELEPPPQGAWPPFWLYLNELAVQRERKNIPPRVAGEWMRAILAGTPYPLMLLSIVLMRIRADGRVNGLRTAILKSVLIRNFNREVPVALNSENTNKGYVLGRLFAVYEEVQRAALGSNVNATIKDKFYSAASASPQKIFRTLDAGSQNHFSKLRKQSPGRAVNLQKVLGSIMDLMNPCDDPIPAALNAADQALFGIGYYHQHQEFFRKHDNKSEVNE